MLYVTFPIEELSLVFRVKDAYKSVWCNHSSNKFILLYYFTFNTATVTPVVLSTHWKVRGAIPAYSSLHAVSLKYPWTRQ